MCLLVITDKLSYKNVLQRRFTAYGDLLKLLFGFCLSVLLSSDFQQKNVINKTSWNFHWHFNDFSISFLELMMADFDVSKTLASVAIILTGLMESESF